MSDNNILGCFASANMDDDNGRIFRTYIWGNNKIIDKIKLLQNKDYGNDLKLILFQFYINPIQYLRENLEEIESYRKKEKSIGIPIIVDNSNFFNKDENGRIQFIKKSMVNKLDLLYSVIDKNNLDTNLEKLKIDLYDILNEY